MSIKNKNLPQKDKKESLKKGKSLTRRNFNTEKPNKESPQLMIEELPLVRTNVPLVFREIPLVSSFLPLVSSRPPITLPRYWGLLPSRQWGKNGFSSGQRKELRPTDIGLFKFLGKVITAAWQPVAMFKGPAERVKEIAEEKKEIGWL